jgi:hypothetical protein
MDEKRPALDQLTDGDFQPRLGQVFRLRLNAEEQLDLTLAQVHTHTYAPPTQGRRGFSITLKSGYPKALPQAIYTLTHDDIGTMELFLVPIGVQGGGMCYEAVFN